MAFRPLFVSFSRLNNSYEPLRVGFILKTFYISHFSTTSSRSIYPASDAGDDERLGWLHSSRLASATSSERSVPIGEGKRGWEGKCEGSRGLTFRAAFYILSPALCSSDSSRVMHMQLALWSACEDLLNQCRVKIFSGDKQKYVFENDLNRLQE